MSLIFKYTLPLQDFVFVDMPIGAKVLDVQDQHGVLRLWAIVDPKMPTRLYEFAIVSTGSPLALDDSWIYITTVQQLNGTLVWHIFQRKDD